MQSTPCTVYVSGPLTHSRDIAAMKQCYERVARICESAGLAAYLPHVEHSPDRSPDLSAEQVFQDDFQALSTAQVIVAFVGQPSLGVGNEIAIAAMEGKSIVAIAWPEDVVSRFTKGLLSAVAAVEISGAHPNFEKVLRDVITNPPSPRPLR